jgi:hypothetical protein
MVEGMGRKKRLFNNEIGACGKVVKVQEIEGKRSMHLCGERGRIE